MYLAAHENWTTKSICDFPLRPTKHDSTQQSAVVEHRVRRLKQFVVQQPDQRPELVLIALMRCGRKEEKISGVPAHGFRQAVVLRNGFPLVLTCQVVRFIENNNIPLWSGEESLHQWRFLEWVNRSDN